MKHPLKHKETFIKYYDTLGSNPKYDKEFLYEVFCDILDSLDSALSETNLKSAKEYSNIDDAILFNYYIHEYDFLAFNKTVEQIEKDINSNEEMMDAISTYAVDKYLANEKSVMDDPLFASKFNPVISTLVLYLRFLNLSINNSAEGIPEKSLIADVMRKSFKTARCSVELLIHGFASQAFSIWRTLHETECILKLLTDKSDELIPAYLRHMYYSEAYRGTLSTKEETDKVFEEIKSNMRLNGFKSKDTKKYIEYGYLLKYPGVTLNEDFKLNFRDGVEKLAGLSKYASVYEFSSEIAHSSPLMIYSNSRELFHLTLILMYQVLFRLEKMFSDSYLPFIYSEQQKEYSQFRNMYFKQMEGLYEYELKVYKGLNPSFVLEDDVLDIPFIKDKN